MISSELHKRITDKIFRIQIFFKSFFPKKKFQKQYFIDDFINKYKDKKRIVVFCSGPSANKAIAENKNLYIATNDGYKFVVDNDLDFLFFLNDQYYINKNLIRGHKYLKNDQLIVLFYTHTDLHKKAWFYLKNKMWMFGDKTFISFSDLMTGVPKTNYESLFAFYKDNGLPLKSQNSGMFILLLGYYIAVKLDKPIDIYGLDLGLGGNLHYDKKGLVTKSISRDRVKVNTKMYLDYMYNHHQDIKNYSNFYGNMTGFKEE